MFNSRGGVTGGEQALDIVLVSKLAKTSAAEPYWKQRTKPTPDGAEAAKLRRQLAEISKDFSGLLNLQQKSDAQLSDLQGKIKVLRQEVAAKDKQLDLCRRTIDRLTDERAQHEGSAAADKAYIRKLESRLLSIKNAVELQSKCSEYKAQAEHMAQQVRLAEGRAAAAEEARQRQQEEAAFLRRGIDLAAEQLTKSGTGEVPAALLMSLARAQEEGMAMSVQLADSQQQVAQMASALQHARTHLLEQQKTVEDVQREGGQAAQQLRAARAELQAERVALAELRHVVASLRQQVSGLREERDGLRHQLELERTTTTTAEGKVVELEAARKQHAKAEAALRAELRELKAAAQRQPQRQQPAGQDEPPPGAAQHAAAAGLPGLNARRPAAHTPSRSKLAVDGAAGQDAGLSREAGRAPSSIQRLRQARQQWRRWDSPEVGGRPMPGGGTTNRAAAAAVPASLAMFDGQQRWQEQQQGLGDASGSRDDELCLLMGEASLGGWEAGGAAGLGALPLAPGGPNQAAPAAAAPAAAAERACPSAPAPGAGKLGGQSASALDEQIAQLEGDLAELSASCSPEKLQRLLLHGLQHEPSLAQPRQPQGRAGAAAGGLAQPEQALPRQERPPFRARQPPAKAPPAEQVGMTGLLGLLSPSKPAAHKPALAAQRPTGKQFPRPSPSKLLQPGWLAGRQLSQELQEPDSRQGSPGIPAWRPNSAFEPSFSADAVVLQASMPEQPSLQLRPAWDLPSPPAAVGAGARPLAAAAAKGSAGGGTRMPPPPLEIPAAGACDRYSGDVLDELSPPLSDAAVPTQGGASPYGAAEGIAGSQQQGLVWHCNPLASTSPLGDAHSPAVSSDQPTAAAAAGAPESRLPHSSQQGTSNSPSSQQRQRRRRPVQEEATRPASSSSSSLSFGDTVQGGRPQQEQHGSGDCLPAAAAELYPGRGAWGEWQRGPTPLTQQRRQWLRGGGPAPQQSPAQPSQDWRQGGFDSIQQEHSQQSEEEAQSRGLHRQWQQGACGEPEGLGQGKDGAAEACSTHEQGPRRDGGGPGADSLPQRRPGSRGSLDTFSRQWSGAPSGATSWLDAAYEPDIEQLEVNSALKPAGTAAAAVQQRRQQASGAEGQPAGGLATLFELAMDELDLDCL